MLESWSSEQVGRALVGMLRGEREVVSGANGWLNLRITVLSMRRVLFDVSCGGIEVSEEDD